MKADYLTLKNGRVVRVDWNMNALGMVTSITGKELGDLFAKSTDYNLLRTIAWCSAIEGEAIEGRELELSELEFGRLIYMANVAKFSQIFAAQVTCTMEKKSEQKGKKPTVHLRQAKITPG